MKRYGYVLLAIPICLIAPGGCSTSPEAQQDIQKVIKANSRGWRTPDMPRCGPRIEVEDIRVIDTQIPDEERELALENVGNFELAGEVPIAVSVESSREQAEAEAIGVAAFYGCNLLLLGPVQEESYISGGDGIGGPGGIGKSTRRYLLFHMGIRDGTRE